MKGEIWAWTWREETQVRTTSYLVYLSPDFDVQQFIETTIIDPLHIDQGILCIAAHHLEIPVGAHGRVVIAAEDHSVRVLKWSSSGRYEPVFSTTLDTGFLLKTVRFCEVTQDILAFSRKGGGM